VTWPTQRRNNRLLQLARSRSTPQGLFNQLITTLSDLDSAKPLSKRLGLLAFVGLLGAVPAAFSASVSFSGLTPGNLVVSRSVYSGTASTATVGQALPPNCPVTASCPKKTATDNGSFPAIGSTNNVWNNAAVDGSFGITAPIFLDQLTPSGTLVSTFAVPTSLLVTSFPSKSEIALNLSKDGSAITFMGYVAPVNTLDVSNSNTPGVYDPTNPVGSSYYRAVAQVDAQGNIQVTETNAYNGNNGRAAAFANGLYYMVGNSNNGSGTPANVVASAGVQIAAPSTLPEASQTPGAPREVGNFSITQVAGANGQPLYSTPDKLGKDNNFRGLTIFNDTLFVTKGSGGNGINTVYQVGNAGTLPTLGNAANAPITILPGFPTTLAKNADATNPFGLWFADSNTLYVSDEGDGTMANAAVGKFAGLQKWSLVRGVWQLDYVLQNGLGLGQPYSVANYPPTLNPATDGLRNLTGRLNGDGTVTLWAITSTVSANGDQGADPNRLVSITDVLQNTNPALAAGEQFTVLETAAYGELLRGVSFTPGTVASAAFVNFDTAPSGNWMGTYGQDGALVVGGGNTLPSYATVGAATASTFVWQASTSDPRGLQKTTGTDRVAATYYANSSFTVDLNLTDGNVHQVALYFLDQDTSSRRGIVSIRDAATGRVLDTQQIANFHNGVYGVWNLRGHVLIQVTNNGGLDAVLSGIFLRTFSPLAVPPTVSLTAPAPGTVSLLTPLTANASAGVGASINNVQFFANGTPVSGKLNGAGPNYTFAWPTSAFVNGSYSLTAVATDSEGQSTTSAPLAVTVANSLTTAVTFVASDTSTEGSWQGKYGAEGDLIAFDSFAPAAYATASFNQGPPFQWALTGATQAMQRRNSPSNRIASAWFAPLTFSLDVNFADGNTHQLALYFLDWDNQGRAETVSVFDANVNGGSSSALDTRTVSNFTLGQYLIWNVRGHVLIQFTKTAGGNAVVNGVFFGGSPAS